MADVVLTVSDRADVYVPTGEARSALSGKGSFNVLSVTSGSKVDLFVVAPDNEFERTRRDRRARADVVGVASWVATAGDVILAELREHSAG